MAAKYNDGDIIIVRYTAIWCAPCKIMKETIKSSKRIQSYLKSIKAYVVLDVDESEIILEGVEIKKPDLIPQLSKFVYFNMTWNEVSKISGARSEEELFNWMKKEEEFK